MIFVLAVVKVAKHDVTAVRSLYYVIGVIIRKTQSSLDVKRHHHYLRHYLVGKATEISKNNSWLT